MSNYACPPCPSCSDSRLSTTANIIGIITFAYVLSIGIIYRVRAVRQAEWEALDMYGDMSYLDLKPRAWEERVKALPVYGLDALFSDRNPPPDVYAAIANTERVCREFDDQFESLDVSLWFGSRIKLLLTLGVWYMMRYDKTKRLYDKAMKCAAKVESLIDQLYEKCLDCGAY
jgi:hypothetical protein